MALILGLRLGQTISIGDNVAVKVFEDRRRKLRILIDAPEELRIVRLTEAQSQPERR